MKVYSVKDVARMLDLAPKQVRAMARAGFLEPDRGERGEYRFSFQDLVLLRAARELEAAQIPRRRLLSSLRKLRDQLPVGYHLSSVKIRAQGDHIVVQRGDEVWNPESGQAEFDFDVGELAEKAATRAGEVVEEVLEDDDVLDPEEWYRLGVELEPTAPDKAREAYGYALEVDPLHVRSRVNLGRLLLVASQLHSAETQFRLALSRGPDAAALFNLGAVLEELRRTDEAIQAYREVVDVDPGYADAYFQLSRLLAHAGEVEAASLCLQTYRKLTKE